MVLPTIFVGLLDFLSILEAWRLANGLILAWSFFLSKRDPCSPNVCWEPSYNAIKKVWHSTAFGRRSWFYLGRRAWPWPMVSTVLPATAQPSTRGERVKVPGAPVMGCIYSYPVAPATYWSLSYFGIVGEQSQNEKDWVSCWVLNVQAAVSRHSGRMVFWSLHGIGMGDKTDSEDSSGHPVRYCSYI